MQYETVKVDIGSDRVATITLNRPHVLNAFNQQMCDEFVEVWHHLRSDEAVCAIVLQAAGDRAFCTGVDRKDPVHVPDNLWNWRDPGEFLGPKSNRVWKPVICAVHGMVAGGAFYWINEADIVIASDDATFFDPHLTYGMTAVLEPMGLMRRVPVGEVMRMSLMGLDERMSAERAFQIGLVSEIVPRADLSDRAHYLAARIADKPTVAVQGTVRALWEGQQMVPVVAQSVGTHYVNLGNPEGMAAVDPDLFESKNRPSWELR